MTQNIYNQLYEHLINNNILYKKRFGFQENHSPEHAIIQFTDQINNSLESKHFTLGNFIDLSKAFDTVDHIILIKKLENYGAKEKNLQWFQSYVKNANSSYHTTILILFWHLHHAVLQKGQYLYRYFFSKLMTFQMHLKF